MKEIGPTGRGELLAWYKRRPALPECWPSSWTSCDGHAAAWIPRAEDKDLVLVGLTGPLPYIIYWQGKCCLLLGLFYVK